MTHGMSRRSFLQRSVAGAVGIATATGRVSAGPHHGRADPYAVPSQQGSPGTLTLATPRAPSDLDPHSAYDAGSGVALRGPFEGLIRLRPGTTDEYDPLLAESWETNSTKSTWSFHLRDGVTFQDGTPLDAFAARMSFERLFTLGLAPSSVLGRFITGADRISVPDSRTLVFDLERPQPLFMAALAGDFGTAIVNVAVLKEHEVDGDWGHAWAQTSSDGLGTGPYRITAFDIETGVILERNGGYWRGWQNDHFDRVILRVVSEPATRRELIENGAADIAVALPLASVRELERNPDLVIDRRANLTVRYLAMTVAGPLVSAEARQALCWAFPYDEVITGVYEGYAKRGIGPVAELCRGFGANTFVYETDLERARTLLRIAGVPAGTTLRMPLPPGNPEGPITAEVFRANLTAIGLDLDVEPVDFGTYVGMLSGDLTAEERPSLLPAFWSPDYNDAWNQLWPQVSCNAWHSGNGGHYCNERVEELLERARTTGDEGAYLSMLGEIQQIVTRDDPAAIYYAQPEWLTVLRRDVAGFTPDLVVGDLVNFHTLSRAERGQSN